LETDSGVPESDKESVRDRHGPVKATQGPKRPRVVRILDAEKASVERCVGTCSVEAGGANSVVEPSPFLTTRMAGIAR